MFHYSTTRYEKKTRRWGWLMQMWNMVNHYYYNILLRLTQIGVKPQTIEVKVGGGGKELDSLVSRRGGEPLSFGKSWQLIFFSAKYPLNAVFRIRVPSEFVTTLHYHTESKHQTIQWPLKTFRDNSNTQHTHTIIVSLSLFCNGAQH